MRHRSPRPHLPIASILLQPPLSHRIIQASPSPLADSFTPRPPPEADSINHSFDTHRVVRRLINEEKRTSSVLRAQHRHQSPCVYSVKTYGMEDGKFGVMTRKEVLRKGQIDVYTRRNNLQKEGFHSPWPSRKPRFLTPDKSHAVASTYSLNRESQETEPESTALRCSAFYIHTAIRHSLRNKSRIDPTSRLPVIYSKLKLSDSNERESVFKPPLIT